MPIGFPSSPTTGQQWPTVNPRWEWDGAKWTAIGGSGVPSSATPVTRRLSTLTNNVDFIGIDGTGPALVAASVIAAFAGSPPAPSAPAVMTVGQWTATPIAGGIAIDIDAEPAGSPTGYERSLDNGGTWATLADGAALGVRNITGLAATERQVRVRGVNAVGPAADPGSDTKTATPLAGGGGSFSAAYVSHAINGTEFQNPKAFPGLAIGVADATRRLYVYLYARGPALNDTITLSVNGGAALTPIASERTGNNSRQVLLFAADVPTGTTADFSFTSTGTPGNDFNNCGIAIIRAVGAHSSATSSSVNFASTSTGIATVAGDRVFLGAMFQGDGGAGFFGVPSGFTEHFDEPTRPSIPAQPATLRSGTAVGGSPETFTGTLVDGAGTSELLLRLRAA